MCAASGVRQVGPLGIVCKGLAKSAFVMSSGHESLCEQLCEVVAAIVVPWSVCLLLETGTSVTEVSGMGCTLNCHGGGFSIISVLPASTDLAGRKTTESSAGT